MSGVVKDNAGEPVIGASIAVKGGTTGTISDIDGKFSLNVAKGAILEVSFIGYKTQEFKIDSSKSLNIVLKDDTEMLDEVVVVGYGTMRKKDLTGSVVQINPTKIADQNPTSVQDVHEELQVYRLVMMLLRKVQMLLSNCVVRTL